MEPERIYHTADVYGVSRDLPITYVERRTIDDKLVDNLTRDKHVVIYGSSKQGKTCLRRHCLNKDYLLVQCQNTWDLSKLSEAILKSAGCKVEVSHSRTSDGKAKLQIRASGAASFLGLAKGSVEGNVGEEHVKSETKISEPFQFDPSDANDLVRTLKALNFHRFIVLEDFHYLPPDTQDNFAFALKTIHETSKSTFISVAVWREESLSSTA